MKNDLFEKLLDGIKTFQCKKLFFLTTKDKLNPEQQLAVIASMYPIGTTYLSASKKISFVVDQYPESWHNNGIIGKLRGGFLYDSFDDRFAEIVPEPEYKVGEWVKVKSGKFTYICMLGEPRKDNYIHGTNYMVLRKGILSNSMLPSGLFHEILGHATAEDIEQCLMQVAKNEDFDSECIVKGNIVKQNHVIKPDSLHFESSYRDASKEGCTVTNILGARDIAGKRVALYCDEYGWVDHLPEEEFCKEFYDECEAIIKSVDNTILEHARFNDFLKKKSGKVDYQTQVMYVGEEKFSKMVERLDVASKKFNDTRST